MLYVQVCGGRNSISSAEVCGNLEQIGLKASRLNGTGESIRSFI